jgi:ParB/RepB/Spo0J family partition protein
MHPLTLPIHDIKVENRQRLDLGDINSLAASLAQYGLIQPIVINQERRLIAGGRRLAAAKHLAWETISVVYRETLSQDELHILELEENIKRLDETWQEKCLHVKTIHDLKHKLAAVDLKSWGQRETGEMLGVSAANINFSLQMARLLEVELDENKKVKENARYWLCDSLNAAWKLWMRDEQDAALAELASRQADSTSELVFIKEEPTPYEPEDLDLERARYEANPHNTMPFEEYWKEKLVLDAQSRAILPIVHLSRQLILGDSIDFMHCNLDAFNHVITDIPYGIDMDMLNQQNLHGQMSDIDTVEKLHDVEYNKVLIAQFFPAAFACTKEHAFVVTWCDQMLWQLMYYHAIEAGFAVQRWPITWYKTGPCMNQCAGYNTTKDTEIAIVCRKPGTTIMRQPNTSVVVAGPDELTAQIRHPFAKPRAVWDFLTDAFTLEGESILEPFMGQGSGVISMLDKNRRVVGVELDQAHYNSCIENVKNLFYLPKNPNFTFK